MGFRVKIAVLAVLPVVAVVVALVASGIMATRADPGLYIVFELYGRPGGADEAPRLSLAGDVYTCVIAEAVLPGPPDFLLLGSGCYSGVPAVYIPHDRIKKAVNAWVLELIARESPSIGEHVFGLILRVYVVNASAREVLYTVLDSIPLRIGDFRTPQAVVYIVRNVKGWPQVFPERYIKPPASAVTLSPASERAAQLLAGTPTLLPRVTCEYCPGCEVEPTLRRELVAEIKPEDLQPYLPSDYFKTVNGVVYLKTPVLIVDNVYSFSGVIGSSINIYMEGGRLEVRLTFGTGEILSSIRNGAYPSLNLQLGGATFGGRNYYYYQGLTVPNATAAWAYMWTRPIQRYWREYLCYYGCCTFMHDVVESLITNILTIGARIDGAVEVGLPHTRIVENLFSGTNITNPWIPNTALDDGVLNVNESITFRYIFQHYDTCGGGFEVGVPVGAYAATAICIALGLPTGGTACLVAIAFASAFQVGLGFEGVQVYVDGGLSNLGRWWGYGYDIYEVIYLRISRYQYEVPPPWWCPWCSPCRFNVPAGLYFRCD